MRLSLVAFAEIRGTALCSELGCKANEPTRRSVYRLVGVAILAPLAVSTLCVPVDHWSIPPEFSDEHPAILWIFLVAPYATGMFLIYRLPFAWHYRLLCCVIYVPVMYPVLMTYILALNGVVFGIAL